MATPETKINRSDLQFFPSERLTDNDDGGGMPLGTPISGEANELFNPISSIARINGGFYARLVYAGVQRADDEPLIGAFAAITKPPSDPTVSYLMFPATKFGELRHEILDRIEAFNVASIESRMTLLSTQTQRSRLVQAYQRVGEPLPLVGDVYCLRQDKAGFPQVEQYVQVASVKSEDRTFTEKSGGGTKDFTVTVVKLEITQALDYDFIGIDYPKEGAGGAPCKIRETSVADAAQYHGIKPIDAPIEKDKQSIKIPTLMEKLVPTNQIETFLTDLNAAGERQTLFDGSKTGTDGIVTLTVNRTHSAGGNTSIYLGNAAVPGTVAIASASGTITDDGNTLKLNNVAVGTISAASGEILINSATFSGSISSVSFRPAGSELQIADTRSEVVTINNRSNIWSVNIDPPPAVGSLMASYRAQGRWYDLRDDGTGKLVGASQAHGSGNVNFVTGSAELTTGELPDVGSAIIWSWGTRARYFNRSDSVATAKMILQLSQDADPASLVLMWNDGAAKTAVCDALGNITGDWTGKYDSATRQIRIDTGANFNHPAGALDITVTSSSARLINMTFDAVTRDGAGNVTLIVGDEPLRPNSININFAASANTNASNGDLVVTDNLVVSIIDNGVGRLKSAFDGADLGTVDYTTGALVFKPEGKAQIPKPRYGTRTVFGSGGGGGGAISQSVRQQYLSGYDYVSATAQMPFDSSAMIAVTAHASDTGAGTSETVASGNIEIDLLPTFAEIVMPASVNVSWGGKRYFDKNGSIYTDLDTKTGAATFVGSIDYQNAKITLRKWDWTNGAAPSITSLATSLEGNPVDSVTFRTPSSPIKPGSMTLRATAIDGTLVTAIATIAGDLTAAKMTGFVDAQFGVTNARFGSWVDAIGNESEMWFDADNIRDDGKIWRPTMVFANTITYNARSFSYLPIDSNVVKIDTVRLPQDGKIPIFRRGDTIIIGNRVTTDIGSAHTGGQTVTLPRNDVTRIAVVDADDKNVNAELWDYDLAAGTITWRTPLDLSMYKMPLKVNHAQEERNRIREADIDGTLSLIFANRRSYPIADTYVSSVLIGGDLQVRVSIPFTQRNWDNVWRDEPKGDQLLNKLNLKDYPMVLTDDGAIKERWMIKMTGTAQFELYGETLGFVTRSDTLTDLAPINPASGKPYFTLPKQAFGAQAPWASQDIIRFNTWGTLLPIWVLCAVQPNPNPPTGTDGYTQCLYGDTTELTV